MKLEIMCVGSANDPTAPPAAATFLSVNFSSYTDETNNAMRPTPVTLKLPPKLLDELEGSGKLLVTYAKCYI